MLKGKVKLLAWGMKELNRWTNEFPETGRTRRSALSRLAPHPGRTRRGALCLYRRTRVAPVEAPFPD